MITLTPPPERNLPPGSQARRRAELLELIAEPDRSRPRALVPLLAAASVVAITAAMVIGGPASRDAESPPVGGPAQAAKPTAPVVRDLDRAELARFRAKCDTADLWAGADTFAGYTTVAGLRFPNERRGTVPAGWLIMRKGATYAFCIENGRGTIVGNAGFGPETVKDIPYLFAPVDVKGQGVGPFSRPVTRVTIQGKDGPEQQAVLRHGFWFASYDEQRYVRWDGPRPLDESRTIGVPFGYTVRGYDASGRRVYDSSTNGPSVDHCYTDPAGTEVLVRNSVPNPTPAKCRRTLPWLR